MSVARCCCEKAPKPPVSYFLTVQTGSWYFDNVTDWRLTSGGEVGVAGGLFPSPLTNGGFMTITFQVVDNFDNIPRGANIISAFLRGMPFADGGPFWQFQEFNPPNAEWTSLIFGNAVANEGGLPRPDQVVRTASTVDWVEDDLPPDIKDLGGVDPVDISTPNLAAMVQEIVNDPSWDLGGSFHLFIEPKDMVFPGPPPDYSQYLQTGSGNFQPGNGWRFEITFTT